MAQLTVLQKINIAKLSQAYATVDILKSGLYAGGIDLDLPRKIYCVRKTIENTYNLDDSDSTLFATSNYLIALCGKYWLSANASISGSGSISPIIPPPSLTYLIPITGSDFADATNYNDNRIIGKSLAIFWNDINRYLFTNEFSVTSTGINILVPGFDATANPTYELFIYIINP